MKIFKISEAPIAEEMSQARKLGAALLKHVSEANELLKAERDHLNDITNNGNNLDTKSREAQQSNWQSIKKGLEYMNTLATLVANGNKSDWDAAEEGGISKTKFGDEPVAGLWREDKEVKSDGAAASDPRQEAPVVEDGAEADEYDESASYEAAKILAKNSKVDNDKLVGLLGDAGIVKDALIAELKEYKNDPAKMTLGNIKDVKVFADSFAIFCLIAAKEDLRNASDESAMSEYILETLVNTTNRHIAESIKKIVANPQQLMGFWDRAVASMETTIEKGILKLAARYFAFVKSGMVKTARVSQKYRQQMKDVYNDTFEALDRERQFQKALSINAIQMSSVIKSLYRVMVDIKSSYDLPASDVEYVGQMIDGLRWMGRLSATILKRGDEARQGWDDIKEHGLRMMSDSDMRLSIHDIDGDGKIGKEDILSILISDAPTQKSGQEPDAAKVDTPEEEVEDLVDDGSVIPEEDPESVLEEEVEVVDDGPVDIPEEYQERYQTLEDMIINRPFDFLNEIRHIDPQSSPDNDPAAFYLAGQMNAEMAKLPDTFDSKVYYAKFEMEKYNLAKFADWYSSITNNPNLIDRLRPEVAGLVATIEKNYPQNEALTEGKPDPVEEPSQPDAEVEDPGDDPGDDPEEETPQVDETVPEDSDGGISPAVLMPYENKENGSKSSPELRRRTVDVLKLASNEVLEFIRLITDTDLDKDFAVAFIAAALKDRITSFNAFLSDDNINTKNFESVLGVASKDIAASAIAIDESFRAAIAGYPESFVDILKKANEMGVVIGKYYDGYETEGRTAEGDQASAVGELLRNGSIEDLAVACSAAVDGSNPAMLYAIYQLFNNDNIKPAVDDKANLTWNAYNAVGQAAGYLGEKWEDEATTAAVEEFSNDGVKMSEVMAVIPKFVELLNYISEIEKDAVIEPVTQEKSQEEQTPVAEQPVQVDEQSQEQATPATTVTNIGSFASERVDKMNIQTDTYVTQHLGETEYSDPVKEYFNSFFASFTSGMDNDVANAFAQIRFNENPPGGKPWLMLPPDKSGAFYILGKFLLVRMTPTINGAPNSKCIIQMINEDKTLNPAGDAATGLSKIKARLTAT